MASMTNAKGKGRPNWKLNLMYLSKKYYSDRRNLLKICKILIKDVGTLKDTGICFYVLNIQTSQSS